MSAALGAPFVAPQRLLDGRVAQIGQPFDSRLPRFTPSKMSPVKKHPAAAIPSPPHNAASGRSDAKLLSVAMMGNPATSATSPSAMLIRENSGRGRASWSISQMAKSAIAPSWNVRNLLSLPAGRSTKRVGRSS